MAVDEERMVAQSAPFSLAIRRPESLRWGRVLLEVTVLAVVTGIDTVWKLAAVTNGHAALDSPTSPSKPLWTYAVLLVAVVGVEVLPPLCIPGALLVASGIASNLFSLALWHAAPNPLSVHIAGGILHTNLADVCVAGGGLLFFLAVLATPADRFFPAPGT